MSEKKSGKWYYFTHVVLKRLTKAWPALIYMIWFILLEHVFRDDSTKISIMHVPLDDKIPFCEYFVVPYFLWFPLMAFVFIYFLFTSEKDFSYACKIIIGGMLVALAIYTIFPNGQDLRSDPSEISDSIFGKTIKWLYGMDTSTNVCPSIHVYNSITAVMVICNSDKFKRNTPVKFWSIVLAVSIILSTMFIKQHSVVDVLTAVALSIIMYLVVYALPMTFKRTREQKELPLKSR